MLADAIGNGPFIGGHVDINSSLRGGCSRSIKIHRAKVATSLDKVQEHNVSTALVCAEKLDDARGWQTAGLLRSKAEQLPKGLVELEPLALRALAQGATLEACYTYKRAPSHNSPARVPSAAKDTGPLVYRVLAGSLCTVAGPSVVHVCPGTACSYPCPCPFLAEPGFAQ